MKKETKHTLALILASLGALFNITAFLTISIVLILWEDDEKVEP